MTGGTVDLGGGSDTLILGDFANTLTVDNVETMTGNGSADTVTLGTAVTGSVDLGAGSDTLRMSDAGNTLTVSNVESVRAQAKITARTLARGEIV